MPSDPVNIHDAKTNLSRLLERVQAGEHITIAKAGTPVAMLVPFPGDVSDAPLRPAVVREIVSPYVASPPGAAAPKPRTVSARELAQRWNALPRLGPDDAAAMAQDIREAREALPPVSPPWE